MTRRSDPEPLTIVAVIASVTSASISAVNFWRTHRKPSPRTVRRKLISKLDKLRDEVRYLRADVDELESIFKDAQFPEGRALRLGNGALLTLEEFRRYQRVTDQVFSRVKRVHKLALDIQGVAFDLSFIDKRQTTNRGDELLTRAERLLQSRNYSVDRAWDDLRALISALEEHIRQLETELGR